MLFIPYFLFFVLCGILIARWQMPRRGAVTRVYIGASFGLLQLLWLPALWACVCCFGVWAHVLAAVTMALMTGAAYRWRDRADPVPLSDTERDRMRLLLPAVVLLTILSLYLQYTHDLRPNEAGGYSVGQSTYGDLSLHLAIASSAVNARFPLHNSLMIGESMAYPYLTDTFASTLMVFGIPLNTAMVITGTLMMAFVYAGYALLCGKLCRKRRAALFAFLLLFLNGGLGFFYTIDATVENGSVTGFWQNLQDVMTGYYHAPTNQPDPHNLRWVNLICDMLLPQRGILCGFTMLMPALNLLLPPLCRREKRTGRETLLLGLFAGGLPLMHTHSFLGLVLLSAGTCVYAVLHEERSERLRALFPWLQYALLAAALSLPQLLCFTFPQTASSDHFLRLWFNWCNNRSGDGKLVDGYLWFYLKNVGIPYALILLALLQRKKRGEPLPDALYQNRLLACGAFLIYLAAECIKFQPNIYDNNKLLYIWFLCCLPMAADYAGDLWHSMRGLAGRFVIAAAVLVICFASAGLTVARECVSDYQAYSAQDIEAAEYIRENTPEHSVFLTGNQHLNPVSSLAGRSIVCSSDLFLYYHGFNTGARRAQVTAFYADPLNNLDVLDAYRVQYIYVSSWEYSQGTVDENALLELFPCVFEAGDIRIYEVNAEVHG